VHLARISRDGPDGSEERIVAAADADSTWFDVRAAERLRLERTGAVRRSAERIAAATVPSSMSEAIAGGDAFLEAAARSAAGESDGAVVEGPPRFVNALDPSGHRDHMVFEEHFSFGYRWQGKPVPDVMYELPISYFGNHRSFIGPDDEVPWPHYTRRLDYELELGIVIGRSGTGLTPDQAIDHVIGLTILNDISARDIQVQEMTGGLGPSKGKHFACGAGPYLVTLDSLPWRDGLRMQARVNGETLCNASSDEMIWSIEEIVAWASQGESLVPGWLLGSGTCNGGSTVEIGRELSPGDVIELEIEGLGVLRNRLGSPPDAGWMPTARSRSQVEAESASISHRDERV
jgi:2-keto-4-pentenoate hydratase/2-oxohepta-3-ene-1,7-dioic acid hydratase in catechol pathway